VLTLSIEVFFKCRMGALRHFLLADREYPGASCFQKGNINAFLAWYFPLADGR
jgi:hypothetical protein